MPRRRPPREHHPEPPPCPTLDLHGETAEGALSRARAWLRTQRAAGARSVRVVTGRGAHSAGPPVLRGEIAVLLERLRDDAVEDFFLEAGAGSFRVELTRPAPVKPRPAPEAAEPELRRRAEEALSDLGVAPTPALLRAEMRRIRDGAGGH